MSNVLLLKENDIPRLSSISGNTDVDILATYIKMAQDGEMKRILTLPLYNKIVADFESDTLSGVYQTIYEQFVVDILVYYSAMNIILFNSFRVDNGGIYQYEPKNATPLEMDEVEKVANRYRRLGAAVELSFNDWIRSNKVKEYANSGSCSAVGNTFKLPWVLD